RASTAWPVDVGGRCGSVDSGTTPHKTYASQIRVASGVTHDVLRICEVGELPSDELRRCPLMPGVPLDPWIDRVPPLEAPHRQGRAYGLLGVAGVGVHVVEPWECRTRDRRMTAEVHLAGAGEVCWAVAVLPTGTTDDVRRRRVDDVLDRPRG